MSPLIEKRFEISPALPPLDDGFDFETPFSGDLERV